MNIIRTQIKTISTAMIFAVLMVLLSVFGILYSIGNTVEDSLYQRTGTPTSEIVLIGMDQRSVDEFGTIPWSRDIVAQAIEQLNADPESRPAVIGVDALYIGPSGSAEADSALAEAAGRYGNVVVGATATIDSALVTEANGDFYIDDYTVIAFEEPYGALKEVTEQGHINAMLDDDGILRHAIWQIDLPDGREIPSFHRVIYERYMEFLGEEDTVTPPTDARHHWYVSFQAQPFAFDDGFSVVDLYNGDLDAAFFKDKIVLIGPYAQGMQDDFTTAVDRSLKMYGVEYQANAIAALLAEDTKLELPNTPQDIFLFLLTFFVMLYFHDRRIRQATIFYIVSLVAWVGLCLLLCELGYLLNFIYVPISLSLAYLLSLIMNYARAYHEKRRVTATFSRYVAPEIVEELLKGDPEDLALGGKLCDVAVLFADIRGFTGMSEAAGPELVVEILNKYMSLMSECVFLNTGTLDKYVGDCTMALWGAPLAQEDCEYKAVKAAMDMLEGAKDLGDEIERVYGRRVELGIGVHYGPAIVGNIGSKTRMDYTAIGDTVNTAARLENKAEGGSLLVSRAVLDALGERAEVLPLGELSLKGKSEGFEVYSVIKLK